MTTYKSAYKTTTFVEDKKINVVHHATKIIEHDVENNTIKLNIIILLIEKHDDKPQRPYLICLGSQYYYSCLL